MCPMTAAQRATLARLRIFNPGARVTVCAKHGQPEYPRIRIKMRWNRTAAVRWVWVDPDGRRELRTLTYRTRQEAIR